MYMWYAVAVEPAIRIQSTSKKQEAEFETVHVLRGWALWSRYEKYYQTGSWNSNHTCDTGGCALVRVIIRMKSTIKHECEFEIIHCKCSCDTGTGNNSYTKYYQTRSWNWNLTMYGYATVRVCIWIWVRICTRGTVKQVSAGGSCTTCAIWIWRYLNNR